ncbi:MAG: LysM domain-containing protein [Intestinibacillus sp.]
MKILESCPFGIIYHEVSPGDTLWIIATKYGATIDEIMVLNPNIKPDNIWAGAVLMICPHIPNSFRLEQYNMPQKPDTPEVKQPDDVTRWYSRGK